MGQITEICNSYYSHKEPPSFEKRYYRNIFKNHILCEECINAYINDVANLLVNELMKYKKTVHMDMLTSDKYLNRSDNFVIINTLTNNTDYMKYILPSTFKISTKFVNTLIESDTNIITIDPMAPSYTSVQDVIDNAESGAIVDVTKVNNINGLKITKGITLYATCNVGNKFPIFEPKTLYNIEKIMYSFFHPIDPNCEWINFHIGIDIRNNYSSIDLLKIISDYLRSYIYSYFSLMSIEEVQQAMNEKIGNDYSSGSNQNPTVKFKCSVCDSPIYNEYYLYRNNIICLDCMYGIVVKNAIDANITDELGLSITGSWPVTNPGIHSDGYYSTIITPEWKRAIISKYCNIMKKYGIQIDLNYISFNTTYR